MAKRFTDTELWDKEWFMALRPKMKCLVKYVRDKCDLAGLWSPNFKLATMCIGEQVTEKDLLMIDSGNQFVKIEGKIFCVGFVTFQYGKLSEKSPVHRKVLSILEKNNISEDTLLKISNTLLEKNNTLLNRVYSTLKEEEEEEDKEVDKDKAKEESKEEEKGPFGQNFPYWSGWLEYKKTEHGEKYKDPRTEQAALTHLFTLSRGDPETAKKIIEQSIANRWKGLFELKNQKSGNQQTTRGDVQAEFNKRVAKREQAGSDPNLKAV